MFLISLLVFVLLFCIGIRLYTARKEDECARILEELARVNKGEICI